jgi:hypothetical protein
MESLVFEVVDGDFRDVPYMYNSPEGALADLEMIKPDMVLVHHPIAQQDLTKLHRVFKDIKIFPDIATLRTLLL